MESCLKNKRVIPGVMERVIALPPVGRLLTHRFVKFGMVGFLGTLVNLSVLYLTQEVFLRVLDHREKRFSLSLSLAIFLATLHNFVWNRTYTWGDRKANARYGFFVQMGQYFLACSLSIVFQFVFTLLISRLVHYLVANTIAIILAAVFVYMMNDIWTFAVRRS